MRATQDYDIAEFDILMIEKDRYSVSQSIQQLRADIKRQGGPGVDEYATAIGFEKIIAGFDRVDKMFSVDKSYGPMFKWQHTALGM